MTADQLVLPGMASHVFTFELWPTTQSLDYLVHSPGYHHTRAITAASAHDARAIAQREAPAGWVVGAGSHPRNRCNPPHMGWD